ncbi:MAG: ankyrin repeat domain-containing protein, partial [Chthoniobacteraceae bacterium]
MNWYLVGGNGGLGLRMRASMRCLLFAALSLALVSTGAAAPADDLVQACAAGDLGRVTALLQKGAKANEADDDGRLPLLAALFSKKEDVVRLLLSRGADPNQVGLCPEKRCKSHPALAFAAYLNEPKLVTLLLNAKADIAFKDHLATRQANVERHVEVYRILRAAGGSPWKAPAQDARQEDDATSTIKIGVNELLSPATQPAKPAGAKLRLAIIADAETQESADLLGTELGNSFDLVERNELDRVLAEQQLARDLTPDAANVQKLGALLGADAIALMRKIDLSGTSLLEVRLVRVSPGIILDTSHRPWPMEDAAKWAKDSAARLAALSAKVRNARAIALSPADFRPASNTPAAVTFARQAALLVSDQFVRRNDVVVLERAALAEMKGERALSRSGQFWAGSYLVDGTAEAPLDSKGVATLTLRLQPMDGKAPLAFTAKGSMAQVKTLVEQLVTQASKALALQPPPAMETATEAERYSAESRAAFQRSQFLAAHRAAETAALLGLDSEEFREWRMKTAIGVVSWQTEKLTNSGGYEGLRWAGWNPEWINACMGGAEWMPLPQWLELAPSMMDLWRQMLCGALESGDLERVQKALDYEKDVVGSFLGIWYSVNLADTLIVRKAQMDALPLALRKVYVDALAIADRKPELAPAQSALAVRLANIAGAAYPSAAEYAAVMKGLLARHFAVEDFSTRIAIRKAAMTLQHQTSKPVYKRTANGFGAIGYGYAPSAGMIPTAAGVFADLKNSKAPEDVLCCEVVRFRLAKQPAERVAISERIFTQLWAMRQLFVDKPEALELF